VWAGTRKNPEARLHPGKSAPKTTMFKPAWNTSRPVGDALPQASDNVLQGPCGGAQRARQVPRLVGATRPALNPCTHKPTRRLHIVPGIAGSITLAHGRGHLTGGRRGLIHWCQTGRDGVRVRVGSGSAQGRLRVGSGVKGAWLLQGF
jgi:hypothetical protein